MKEETKHLTEALLSSPKVGYLAVMITTIEAWWVEWLSPLVDACASISALILLAILIRYHIQNTKKINLEIKKLDRDYYD